MYSAINHPACAFLFDSSADELNILPLHFFIDAVLDGLGAADSTGSTRSRLMTGLPMLNSFAGRITAVYADSSGDGHTQSYDSDTYKYVIWEWLDSLALTWSTIDRDKGSKIFMSNTGECVALVSLNPVFRELIDVTLRTTPGYIGAFEIDPGNPIHCKGFIDILNYSAAIVDGAVVQERSYEGEEIWLFDGADRFKPGGLRWESPEWFYESGPPCLAKPILSRRGEEASRSYVLKHKETVEGRVLRAIKLARGLDPNKQTYQFTMTEGDRDVLEVLIPDGKFTGYLFNREHKQGGSKASFFIDVLGIEPDDWRYLAAQFYYGLLAAEPSKLKFKKWDSGYGMRFNVDIRVRGRAGRSAVVCTGWMMTSGSLPSLSSAIPGDRDTDLPDAIDPPVLPPGPRSEAEWKQLWTWANAAGIKAANTCVPTPMYISGEDIISEGECGNALVRVRDARQGFARWLSKSDIGKADGYGGSIVISPVASQSRDRAIAWAREVIVTLKINGVIAELETFYT